MEYSFCQTKHLIFGFIPFGRECGLGWTELTFYRKVLTVNEIEREVIRHFKLRGAKNPSVIINWFREKIKKEKKK